MSKVLGIFGGSTITPSGVCEGLIEIDDYFKVMHFAVPLLNYFASIETQGSLKLRNGGGTPTGHTDLGSFTDRVRDDSVGTHPTDGAISVVNTYTISQKTDPEAGSYPELIVRDSDGEIRGGTDAEIKSDLIDTVIIALVVGNPFISGQYKLQETAPTDGSWTSRGDIIDTQVDGTTVTKTLWQKTAASTSILNGNHFGRVVDLGTGEPVVTNGGSGYSSPPTVTISAPTGFNSPPLGKRATATASINGSGQVTGITITNPGFGYKIIGTAPTVSFSGGGGSGAEADVTVARVSSKTPIKQHGPNSFIQLTEEEISSFHVLLGERIEQTGIGKYAFSASAPASGTWMQMGEIMSDQAKDSATYAYAGQFTGPYVGHYQQNYLGTYAGSYAGSYQIFYSGFTAGNFTGNYSGTRSYWFTGYSSASFSGTYTGYFDGATIISSSSTQEQKRLWVRIA